MGMLRLCATENTHGEHDETIKHRSEPKHGAKHPNPHKHTDTQHTPPTPTPNENTEKWQTVPGQFVTDYGAD